MAYNIETIRQLVMAAFNDKELSDFCFGHFDAVYQDFTEGQTKSQRVRQLVDFATRRGQLDALLAEIKEANPYQFDRFQADVRSASGSGVLVDDKLILIPSGPFLMGSDDPAAPPWERKQHTVSLPAYCIGKYPVTNREYAQFIKGTRRLAAPELGWEGQNPPSDKLDHPVTGVTWYDALAYCDWLREQTGCRYALPNEAQWEKAARGADGRSYPWGAWADGRCHQSQPGVAPVSAYPAQSPYGCYDMVGNVRQWTRALWGEKRKEIDPAYLYPWANDSRNDLTAASIVRRIYRGGAAADELEDQRCTARHGAAPDSPGLPGKRFGLRVVMELDDQ
jgi:formylglycine-generating enzyme required for sulfatase activity